MTWYLGLIIGYQISLEDRFKIAFKSLKQKLTYWYTIKQSLVNRILIANQVLFASV